MNKFKCLIILLISIAYIGCTKTNVNSSIDKAIEPKDGKIAIITTSHKELSKFSLKLSKAISDSLSKSNIESEVIEYNELSLEEDSFIKSAIAKNSECILVVSLTNVKTRDAAISSIEGNAQLISIREKKILWQSDFRFSISLSGPWSNRGALESISAEITKSIVLK